MWLTVLGALLVVAVLVDLGWTTLAPAAGKGPLTRAVGRLTWRATARSWSHTARQARGYVVLVGVLLTWVAVTWFGWSLVFLGADGAVVDSATGESAGGFARVAYAGTSMLGGNIGFAAGSASWGFATALAAFTGFAEVSLSVTYLFQVVSATGHKRATALAIDALGSSPAAIVSPGLGRPDLGPVGQALSSLAVDLALVARHHRSLPVLHFLHVPARDSAIEVAAARLSDAILVAEVADGSSPTTRRFRTLLGAYLDTVPIRRDVGDAPPAPAPPPDRRDLEPAIVAAAHGDHERRARFRALVEQNAWSWDDVEAVVA